MIGITSVILAKVGTQRKKRNWVPAQVRLAPGKAAAFAFAGVTLMMIAPPAGAQDKVPPYWASIASGEAMMRTGPGRNYPGIWLYKRRDLPIRVVQVYPNWRRIEDPDGQQGWMLVTLLSDRRTALVKPGAPRDIRVEPDTSSPVRYRVEAGVVGRIDECSGAWCRIEIGKRRGYIARDALFGLDAGEAVD